MRVTAVAPVHSHSQRSVPHASEPKVVQIVRPASIRARMPTLSSGARRLAVQCSAHQLSTSARGHPGRRSNQVAEQPVPHDDSPTPGDSTWWSDPSSGERRQVKLSRFRTLMLDSSYRPIAVVKYATLPLPQVERPGAAFRMWCSQIVYCLHHFEHTGVRHVYCCLIHVILLQLAACGVHGLDEKGGCSGVLARRVCGQC